MKKKTYLDIPQDLYDYFSKKYGKGDKKEVNVNMTGSDDKYIIRDLCLKYPNNFPSGAIGIHKLDTIVILGFWSRIPTGEGDNEENPEVVIIASRFESLRRGNTNRIKIEHELKSKRSNLLTNVEHLDVPFAKYINEIERKAIELVTSGEYLKVEYKKIKEKAIA